MLKGTEGLGNLAQITPLYLKKIAVDSKSYVLSPIGRFANMVLADLRSGVYTCDTVIFDRTVMAAAYRNDISNPLNPPRSSLEDNVFFCEIRALSLVMSSNVH